MTEINNVCSHPQGRILRNGLNGTKLIIILTTLTVETVVFVYVIRKMWCSSQVSKRISYIVTTYHICFMLWLVILCILFLNPVFSDSTYDFSNTISCITITNISSIPFTPLYLSLILFWFTRLKGVFQRSKYQISQKLNLIIISSAAIACVSSIICLLYGLMLAIIAIDNGNADKIFCLYTKHVLDFYPFVYDIYDEENNNVISYQYKLENWRTCFLNRNTWVQYLSFANNIIGAISVPSLNAILFYQYVKRMKQHGNDMRLSHTTVSNSSSNSNSNGDIYSSTNHRNVYLNGLLGIISVSTTLLSLVLFAIDPDLFSMLFFIDLFVNGILMIMVLRFGNWLICPCCQTLVDKLISMFENVR